MKKLTGFQKQRRYERIVDQLEPLLAKSPDVIAQMATVVAVLYHKMDGFFWCGFYFFKNGQMNVGPYQGPLACQVLPAGKGVCHAAVAENTSLLVPDVHQFPDHIACDSRSKSEIVVPFVLTDGQKVVLDIDSDELSTFDETDRIWLEKIVSLIH